MRRSPVLPAGVLLVAVLSLAAAQLPEVRPITLDGADRAGGPAGRAIARLPVPARSTGALAWQAATPSRAPEPPVPLPEVEPARPGWTGFVGGLESHVLRTLARSRMSATWRPPVAPPAPTDTPGDRTEEDPPAPDGPGASETPGPAVSVTPAKLRLGPLVPNPSTAAVSVELDLPAPAVVRVRVLDLAGRLVSEKLDRRDAGRHILSWSSHSLGGRTQPPGVYFVRVAVDGRTLATRRWVVAP